MPLNAWWTADEIDYGLRDSGSRVLIAVACQALQDIGATHALVKSVRGDEGGGLAYDVAGFVDRFPDLFDLIGQSSNAAAYRIDLAALAECAAG